VRWPNHRLHRTGAAALLPAGEAHSFGPRVRGLALLAASAIMASACNSQFIRRGEFDYLCKGSVNPWTLKEEIRGKSDRKKRLISYCWLRQGITYDACETLQTVGTDESIPFLIFALRNIMPDEAEFRIKFPDWRGASAPTEPCVIALQRITGRDFVFWEDWQSWWLGQGHRQVPATGGELYP
jgi:hypothetical protein